MLLETVAPQTTRSSLCYAQKCTESGSLFSLFIYIAITLACGLHALPMNAIAGPESTGTDRLAAIESCRPSPIPFQQDTLQTDTAIEMWDCFEILPPYEVTDGNESYTIDFKDLQAVQEHLLELDPNINQVQFVFPISLEFPTNEVLEIFSLTQLQSLFDECQSE